MQTKYTNYTFMEIIIGQTDRATGK